LCVRNFQHSETLEFHCSVFLYSTSVRRNKSLMRVQKIGS